MIRCVSCHNPINTYARYLKRKGYGYICPMCQVDEYMKDLGVQMARRMEQQYSENSDSYQPTQDQSEPED